MLSLFRDQLEIFVVVLMLTISLTTFLNSIWLVHIYMRACSDIDECKHPEAYPCYGICINMPGSFHCHCPDGTYGDPLIKQGCVTTKKLFTGLNIGLMISGGAIILFLALVSPLIKRKIKSSRANKQKERLFKQNHGLLLRQLISHKRDFGERMIITLLDLQKATNNVALCIKDF